MLHEFFGRESNVFDDLPQQQRRNVTTAMKWDPRAASIGVRILFMRATLSDFDKS
jgi:hypothetical protein